MISANMYHTAGADTRFSKRGGGAVRFRPDTKSGGGGGGGGAFKLHTRVWLQQNLPTRARAVMRFM